MWLLWLPLAELSASGESGRAGVSSGREVYVLRRRLSLFSKGELDAALFSSPAVFAIEVRFPAKVEGGSRTAEVCITVRAKEREKTTKRKNEAGRKLKRSKKWIEKQHQIKDNNKRSLRMGLSREERGGARTEFSTHTRKKKQKIHK